MYFTDVLKNDIGFLRHSDGHDKRYKPIYDEQFAREEIIYFTRDLYKRWDKKTRKGVDGIYVAIYQNPDYSEHMGGSFSPGYIHVDYIHKNGANMADSGNCHVFRIRHIDISDEEIEKIFDYCRRYIYNLNPENYRHKITRMFTLEDVRELAKANGLIEDFTGQQFYPNVHLFYLPENSGCNWMIQFDENENYIAFKATKFIVDPKRYYLHSTPCRRVYDLYEAKILLPRVIEDYYDKYPKFLKMDLERSINTLD